MLGCRSGFQSYVKAVSCIRHSSYVECNDISTRSIRFFDNLFFKFNISLPLVTGELLQKTVDVTYKLYNIKYIKTTCITKH